FRLRFFAGVACFFRFRGLFFPGGFGGFSEFHCPDEETGEESATQECITEKFPGLRVAGRALRQGRQPASEIPGVFWVPEWIEKPGCCIRDEIEEHRSEDAAAE